MKDIYNYTGFFGAGFGVGFFDLATLSDILLPRELRAYTGTSSSSSLSSIILRLSDDMN